jgi:hypothetical protein
MAVALACLWGGAFAQDRSQPRVHFNQTWIEEVVATHSLNMKDGMAVFALVFESLPDSVIVYPTENYYYYSFVRDGRPYQGNIRLDPRDRDDGKLHFDVFASPSVWNETFSLTHSLDLDQSHGVTVEKVERLVYRVSFRGKGVVFTLNDLSAVKPPPAATHAAERYLGPIFDESGIRFFFVYNRANKVFHYVLDETVPVADELVPVPRSDRILIGRRTGFAFYRDHRRERKILIGVHDSNSRVNNYLDGPFDQLPENFIEGNELHDAIVDADPSVKGKIGRLGHYIGSEGRYLIDPYMTYRRESELMRVERCAAAKAKRARDYDRCFHTPTR